MSVTVQRITFPRPEPQNTAWLSGAGLPRTPIFTGAFSQQRTAILVGPQADRPPQYDASNQPAPIFYRLPTTPTFTGAIYPRKYDPWAAPKLNPIYDVTDQPGWIFASLPVAGATVAQQAPAFAQQRTAVLLGARALRDITLDVVVDPGALPFAGLATTPLFSGSFAQQRSALVVDKAPGRPIQFDSVIGPLPFYGLPTTPMFTAAFVRRYDPWPARTIDVTFDRTDQPGWLFTSQPQPGATVPQQAAAFAQQRTAYLPWAAPGLPLPYETMVRPGALPFAGLPGITVLTGSFAQRRADALVINPAHRLDGTPPGGWIVSAFTPGLTVAQMLPAFQQHAGFLTDARIGQPSQYDREARWPTRYGLPVTPIFTGALAQNRAILVERRPGIDLAYSRMVQLPPFVLPEFPPPAGGFTFKEIRTERDFAIAARRREFIATSSGRIFVVPKQGAGA